MKKKLFTVLAAFVLVLTMGCACVMGAEEAETPAGETAQEILGFYILNYAQNEAQVNLNIISESDLTAVSEQADTTIYQFCEDGSAVVYDRGEVRSGTYEYGDGILTISINNETAAYDYEFIDGLLIIRSGEESSILYGFSLEDMNYISIEDYSAIELDQEYVTVSDETVESYIRSILRGQTVSEEVTEGITQTGDIISIAFEGILEGETEPFEGGSADSLTLQLGSGALIADYEEQLTGKEIGSTLDVVITFPEDYSGNADLIGKTATFTTTILSKTVVTTPELTDEWVKTFTREYLPEELSTVEEFRTYCRGFQEKNVLHAAIFNALTERAEVTGYNGDIAQMLLNYAAANLSSTAGYYGYDVASYVSQMGYESTDAYLQAEASSYITSSMIVNKVLVDQGIHYTQEELEHALAEYVRSGFGDKMTVEEYKQQVGDIGIWAYTNMVFKYDLAMKALEDRVTIS